MQIERNSLHFRILERLCTMARPVRGISGTMLDRHFGAPGVVEELAGLGLIQTRGWANGPGMIWIPTPEGEALYRELADRSERPVIEPVDAPADPRAQSGTDP